VHNYAEQDLILSRGAQPLRPTPYRAWGKAFEVATRVSKDEERLVATPTTLGSH